MAGTPWNTLIRPYPRSWLLGTGEIINEPALEQSPGGRRVRIAGSTKSWSNYDLDDLLDQAIKAKAKAKRTNVWIELTKPLHLSFTSQALNTADTPAALHLLNPTAYDETTTAWWIFKDTATPYYVILAAILTKQRSMVGTPHNLEVALYAPVDSVPAYDQTPDIKGVRHSAFRSMLDNNMGEEMRNAWITFIRDNPVEWADVLHAEKTLANAREGVLALLNVVREVEEWESIQVPDLANMHKPSWRTLDLFETNVNGAFINDLSEYLDGLPVVEVAAQHYAQMLAALKAAGIHVEGKDENDFMAAMLNGDKVAFSMQVLRPASEEGPQAIDEDHKISVHLPTGTFIVECSHQQSDPDQVAEAWNEALVIAQLSGEEDALLAYAREYAKSAHKRRTKTILKQRGATK